MHDQPFRREYVLDTAVAAGKFAESRRAHYRQMYDRDPAGTEQLLAALASVGSEKPPYPRELFPELARLPSFPPEEDADAGVVAMSRRQPPSSGHAPAPAAHASSGMELTPENVSRWSAELFPETAAGGQPGLITFDQKYRRGIV